MAFFIYHEGLMPFCWMVLQQLNIHFHGYLKGRPQTKPRCLAFTIYIHSLHKNEFDDLE